MNIRRAKTIAYNVSKYSASDLRNALDTLLGNLALHPDAYTKTAQEASRRVDLVRTELLSRPYVSQIAAEEASIEEMALELLTHQIKRAAVRTYKR